MNSSLKYSLAALIAAGSLAAGAAIQPAPTYRAESDYTFAKEPVASAMGGTREEDAGLVNQVVEALNQDGSLKLGKVTVSAEKGLVTLTGSAATAADVRRASEIAATKVGDGNVVNVIQPARIQYQSVQEQESLKKLAQMPDEQLVR